MNRFSVSFPTGDFDLAVCVTSGQVFRWQKQPDGRWLGVDGDQWYRVESGELDREGTTTLNVESNATSAEFSQLFRLDWNARSIAEAIVESSPEMAPYVIDLAGLRLMRPSCSTESFFSFLCTPNNNLTRILQMARHLAAYGPVMAMVDGTPIHRFPDVETIAAIPEADLRAKGFGYRAATIPNIADAVARHGPGWIESLKLPPYEEVHQTLCQFRGIGPKLADCIALFALHHTEAIPIDTHIWQAYVRLYRPEWSEKAVTEARYREAAAFLRSKFGVHGGWAQQYLFYDNMVHWRSRQ